MIFIALDTNTLYIPDSVKFDVLEMSKDFQELITSVLSDNLRDDVTILVPEVTIRELCKQRCEKFNEAKEKIFSEVRRFGELVKVSFSKIGGPLNYFFESQIIDCLSKYKCVERLPICEDKFFSSIVERSLNKEAPFEGTKGGSDKGFKDAVMYYSLVNYAQTHSGEFILVTRDKMLREIELKRIFRDETGKELKTFTEISHVKDEIMKHQTDEFISHVDIEFDEKKFTRGNLGFETRMPISIRIPKIKNATSTLSRINNDLKEICEEALVSWESIDLQPGPYWPDVEYEGKIDAFVTNNKEGILSVLFKEYAFYGGAHGGRRYTGRVYDLNTGYRLKLSNLLGISEEEVIRMICKLVEEDKVLGVYEYYEDFSPKYKMEDEINWYLEDQTIHIIFNEYEAGCYASGIHEILINLVNE